MRNHTKTVAVPVQSVEQKMEALHTTVNRFRNALSPVELNELRIRAMDEYGISVNQYINFLEQK
jgi:hypothetical protein